MTPLQIHLILWHYSCGSRFPANVFSERIVREELSLLVSSGLFERLEDCSQEHHGFKATEKGEAYVEALTALRLPVRKWVLP